MARSVRTMDGQSNPSAHANIKYRRSSNGRVKVYEAFGCKFDKHCWNSTEHLRTDDDTKCEDQGRSE